MKKNLSETLLFETIKIENGKIFNIEWHNQRFNQSRLELFKERKKIMLEEMITPPKKGLFRCRVLFNKKIISIKYIPYQAKEINSIKIVKSDLSYMYKYDNRDEISRLMEKKYDEIIIEKNGFLTDTSIANIAFYDGINWITPSKPLLNGTMREQLLAKKLLIQKDIRKEDIKSFSNFALMNAMIGFQIKKSVTIT